MKRKVITGKFEGIRRAHWEAVARKKTDADFDFRSWIGLALKGPLNPKPRFRNEDDLWS